MNTNPPPVAGHDAPAFREPEAETSPGITTREERVEGMFALGRCQLGAVVEQVDLQPVSVLPVTISDSEPDLPTRSHSSNCVSKEFNEDDLELLRVDGSEKG